MLPAGSGFALAASFFALRRHQSGFAGTSGSELGTEAACGSLFRDLELLFVEERVLAQDDLQAMGFVKLTHELTKRTLKVMRDCRVDHEGDLLANVSRCHSKQLTADLEAYSR